MKHHNQIHGHNKRGKRTATYRSWQNMKLRCYNPKNNRYQYYGARGIKVCDRWLIFVNFLADMEEKPKGTELDRIDNDGNYCPENCRWVVPKTNSRNRRSNCLITFNGKTQTLIEWTEELDLKYETIRARINRYSWSVEKALAIPINNDLNVSGRYDTARSTTKPKLVRRK